MTAHEGEAERLVTGYTGRMSIALSLGWLVALLGREALPPLLPAIIEGLSITPARAGFALTVLWALYAGLQYPGGRFSDRLSRTTVLAASLCVMIVGFGVLSAATAYPLLLLGVTFVGAGAGAYFVAMRALLMDLFVERRGQAFGIQSAAGSVGSALAAGLAVAALSIGAWRLTFIPVAVGLGIVLAVLHRWSREPYVFGRVDLGLRETGVRVFRTPRIRGLAAVYSLYAISYQAVVGFLPTFLQAERGFSPALASGAFAALFVAGMVVSPVSGNIGDRFSHTSVALGALGLACVGVLGLAFAHATPLILLSIVVFAAGIRGYPPVMQAYVMELFPAETAGGDFGAFRTVYVGVGSLGPTLVGLVAERASFAVAYVGAAGAFLAAAAILVWLRQS